MIGSKTLLPFISKLMHLQKKKISYCLPLFKFKSKNGHAIKKEES